MNDDSEPEPDLICVQRRNVDWYRDPGVDGYQTKRTLEIGESFELAAIPNVVVRVSDLFPPE